MTIGKIILEFQKGGDVSKKQAAAAAVAASDRHKLNDFLDILTSPECHDQHLTLVFGILLAYMEASQEIPALGRGKLV